MVGIPLRRASRDFGRTLYPRLPLAGGRPQAIAARAPVERSAADRPLRRSPVRGRRKDDAVFIAIGTLLALLFIAQAGWVIAQHAQS